MNCKYEDFVSFRRISVSGRRVEPGNVLVEGRFLQGSKQKRDILVMVATSPYVVGGKLEIGSGQNESESTTYNDMNIIACPSTFIVYVHYDDCGVCVN